MAEQRQCPGCGTWWISSERLQTWSCGHCGAAIAPPEQEDIAN